MFRKKKQQQIHEAEATHKVAGRIVRAVRWLQEKWVTLMERSTKSFTRKHWMVGLCFFGLITGGLSIYLIVDSFSTNQPSLTIHSIRRPRYVTRSGDERSPAPGINDTLPLRLKKFLCYMDSLQQSSRGKRIYDSIQRVRPGLLDSVRQLQGMYDSHTLK